MSSGLGALDPRQTVTQYKLDIWQAERGFEQNSLFAILQTRDGYIWLGTVDGLVRFDGVRFKVFNKNNTEQLKDNTVRALCEGRDGSLWIGTLAGGLSRLKNGEFTVYDIGPLQDFISPIIEDRTGAIWFGTRNHGVTRLKDRRFTTYTTADGLVNNDVHSICEDKSGNLWFGTSGGLTRRTPEGRSTVYTAKDGLVCDYIYSLCQSENGELWIGTNAGLYRMNIDKRSFTRYGTRRGLPDPQVMCLYEDRDRNLWGGTDGGGVFRVKNGKIEGLSLEDGMACGYIYAIHEDREGSLWIGTIDGGLHRLMSTIVTPYTIKEGLRHNVVESIYEDRAGGLWIGTEGGPNRLKNGELAVPFTGGQKLLNHTILSILEDRSGTLWFGTDAGLMRLKENNLTSFTTRDGIPHDRVLHLLEDHRGDILLATPNGLSRYREGKFTTFIRKEELSNNIVTFLHEDREENLWIGTEEGLHRMKNNRLSLYTTREGLVDNTMLCIYEDSDGVLYFGFIGGLSRRENGKFTNYTPQNGLSDSYVYYILEDDKENLWLAGATGISRIGKRELADFDRGKIKILRPTTYNEQDGMKTSWCNSVGEKSRDGRLWFGTNKGVAMVDPANIKINPLPPPVIIEELKVDGEDIKLNGLHCSKANPLVIPPGKERLDFYYTALSFLKPQKVKFKLKLEGYDAGWIDRGNARGTTYTRLAPGFYTLKVIACNSDGIWNQDGASLYFYMEPYFWQTTWFYVLAILFFVFAAFSGYRFRVKQLKDREKKLSSLVDLRTQALNERTLELEKAHGSLQLSKGIIEEKNRNILASINYAQKIQQAVLPPDEKINTVLSDYFIVFKPRDIVSGDFYWFSHLDDRVFIAAVDCTGHGVPGAFLSMIGNITLNEIVKETQITNPGQILCRLHLGVRSVLQQEKEDYKSGDGMEVGMCLIDLEKGKLTFAGAKRPLFYVKNSEFFEIKGDKRPIGGRQKEKKRTFTNHEIDVQSETIIYLTTDGFVDQHNGENKKYGSLRLKRFLRAIAHLPMEQQEEAILRELNDHQGTENQRDDITVIGIKLRGKG